MRYTIRRFCLMVLTVSAAATHASGELLVDSYFDAAPDSAALRANGAGQDWYESRGHTPERLTLTSADLGGNAGNKAALTNFGSGGVAYLTQEFSTAQSGQFVVSFDIYVDRIEDNGGYDRSGLVYIGDDSIASNAPTGTSNERFVLLGFYDSTPADVGDDLEIRARTSSGQSWSATSSWTSVATGLSYDEWYTVKLVIDVLGTYDVYVNEELRRAAIPKYSGYSSSSVELITFSADGQGRGDFYVDNVFAQALVAEPPEIVVDADFDSGSVHSYSVDGNTVNVALRTEQIVNTGADYTYWVNFTLADVSGRDITVNLTGIDAVPFLAHQGPQETQMVYSCDGEIWERLTDYAYSPEGGGTYTITQTFPCAAVQIATFLPFSYARMQAVLDEIGSSPWATQTLLGTSFEGREIRLITITNPAVEAASKRHVYSIGRQHAAETASSHMLGGMMDFLVSSAPDAGILRDHFIWYVVPMVNPDGVHAGNSRATSRLRDANRDWANDETAAVTAVRNHMELIHATHTIDLFLDWHSQMSDKSWFNYVYSPPGNALFPFLSSWTDFDQEKALGTSCSAESCSSRGYATSQGVFTFVLEPTPHLSTWTTASLRDEGIHTAYAIADYFGAFAVDSEPPTPEPEPPSGWTELMSDDFESGWGSYTDGGSDCRLSDRDAAFAHQGTYCVRIRDDSGTASSFYSTSGVDVATPGYTEINVDFWYYPRSMETGESFRVEYYDGSGWQTVAQYTRGPDFANGSFYHVDDLIIAEGAPHDFPPDMKIRFRCDASNNRDYVYVDEVVVSAR